MERWAEDEEGDERRTLLLHYVNNAQRTVESIDQLGNFLMGFGVLALGYLLHADVQAVAGEALRGSGEALWVSRLTLGAWGVAVGLLVCFVLTYINAAIVGRSVHAHHGREDGIGEPLEVPDALDWRAFIRDQRTYAEFLRGSYRPAELKPTGSLLYARWTYMRFMALQKLGVMRRMRRMLGLALVCGVAFKALATYLGAGA